MAYEDIGYRLSLVMLEVQLPENRGRQRTEFRHSTFTSGLTLSIFAFGLFAGFMWWSGSLRRETVY